MWRITCLAIALIAVAGGRAAAQELDLVTQLQKLLEQVAVAEKGNQDAATRCDREAMLQFQEQLFALLAKADEIVLLSSDPGVNLNYRLPIGKARETFAELEKRVEVAWMLEPTNCPQPSNTDSAVSAAGAPAAPPPFVFRNIDPKPIELRVVKDGPSSRRLVILGGAGAAAAGVLSTVGGGTTPQGATAVSPQPPIQQTPPASPPPPVPPPPVQPTPDSFNGTYGGNLTVTENNCRFPQTAGFSAALNLNSSGNGTLQFTYLASGQQQPYVFNNVTVRMSGSQASFEAETMSTQFGYRLVIQGTLAGTAFTGRISFFDASRGNCHTGYVIAGTRQ